MVFLDMASENEKANRGSTGSLPPIVLNVAVKLLQTDCVTAPSRTRKVEAMAIPHTQPGQPADIAAPVTPGALSANALFKSRDLEVMRLLIPAGKGMPPHRVPGEITVQCVSGQIEIGLDDSSTLLEPGQLLYLAGDAMHSVRAVTDACALVTIALVALPSAA
jgi:quercetin dioxygenase-like cupin family protein